jgi:hypothetical protein
MTHDLKEKKEFKWQVPEYEKHKRSKNWYILAALAGIFLIIYAFLSSNFLFAVIIIVSAVIVILNDGQEPEKIKIIINDEGVTVGKTFYDFDEFKNFSIIYKPRLGVKNLYFEFNSAIKHRLSIALDDMNPLLIRDHLLKYVSEDLERTNRPVSEELSKMLKL